MLNKSINPFIEKISERLSSFEKSYTPNLGLKPAAVALLLFEKNGLFHIVFNKRTQKVEHHKGEISFPGGMKDEGDIDLEATALRETWEEMGIRHEHITVLGELDDFPTTSGFNISPFVGIFTYPYSYDPSPIEVAEILEVPLNHLLQPANQTRILRNRGSKSVVEYSYQYQGHLIWGATARILTQFLTLID